MKRYAIIIVLIFVGYAIAERANIPAFNSGVVSPKVYGRTDIDKYYSGLRTLENMYPKVQGSITKRPGTYYIADANAVMLAAFVHSSEQTFVLEFSNEQIRFFTD